MSWIRILSLCLLAGGCTYIDESDSAAPPGKVAPYLPPPDQYVKSKLLDFDSPIDTSFVTARDVKLVDDPQKAGNRVLLTASTSIKFGALVRGRDFPGMWDLVGVRVRSNAVTPLKLEMMTTAGTALFSKEAATGPQWSIEWIELGKLPTSMPAGQELFLSVRSGDGKPVQIDEILLAQSRTVVVRSSLPQTGEPWVVARSGLWWRVKAGDEEILSLPAAPFVANGYRVLEANPVRVVFGSATGMIALDRNGRLIENRVARLDTRVAKFAKTAAENAAPATVEVDPEQGRIERNLPGDSDNDGYDETRGCYTIRSTAKRLNVRLTPGAVPVRWPVVEVIGLPAGVVSVWMEGQLVPYVTRLSDGKTVIELPVLLERSIEAQIRVK